MKLTLGVEVKIMVSGGVGFGEKGERIVSEIGCCGGLLGYQKVQFLDLDAGEADVNIDQAIHVRSVGIHFCVSLKTVLGKRKPKRCH